VPSFSIFPGGVNNFLSMLDRANVGCIVYLLFWIIAYTTIERVTFPIYCTDVWNWDEFGYYPTVHDNAFYS
jgi:hypothetical protein